MNSFLLPANIVRGVSGVEELDDEEILEDEGKETGGKELCSIKGESFKK